MIDNDMFAMIENTQMFLMSRLLYFIPSTLIDIQNRPEWLICFG